VLVDRDLVLHLVGVQDEPPPTTPEAIVIDGGTQAAVLVQSTSGGLPVRLTNLTLRGATGLEAAAATDLREVKFEDIGGTAMVLTGGSHTAQQLTLDARAPADPIGSGIVVGAGANLNLSRALVLNVTGVGLQVDDSATVETILIGGGGGGGIVLGSAGSLTLSHATVTNNAGVGLDNSAGGTLTATHTLLQGNTLGDVVNAACASFCWSNVGSLDCSSVCNNLHADCLLTADYRLNAGSPCLEHGPDPLAYTGTPCRDLGGGPRLRDYDGNGLPTLDVGAYENRNATLIAEPANLRWTDASTLVWDAVPGSGIEYHVYRDAASALSYSHVATCKDADLDPTNRTDTTLTDAGVPPAGQAWAYCITADDAADESSLGCGACAERPNTAPCS
jgi:hypothetical protein